MADGILLQTCTNCNLIKPLSAYSKQASRKSGIRCACKDCLNKKQKTYYCASDKQKISARKYRDKNPDLCKANYKKWLGKNRDLMKSIAKKWRQENPDAVRASQARRRAKMCNSSENYSTLDIKNLYKKQRGKCVACECDLFFNYHADHIMPLALGGGNDKKNIQLLCAPCNLQKNSKHPIDFMRSKGFLLQGGYTRQTMRLICITMAMVLTLSTKRENNYEINGKTFSNSGICASMLSHYPASWHSI